MVRGKGRDWGNSRSGAQLSAWTAFYSMSITLWVQSAYALTERRFSLDDTVAQLKAKLEIITGVKAAHQRLSLTTSNTATDGHDEHHQNQRFLFSLDEDERVIATYNVRDYLTLKVRPLLSMCDESNLTEISPHLGKVDSTDPAAHTNAQQFTDLSRVDKFELTREEYELRPGTVPLDFPHFFLPQLIHINRYREIFQRAT